MSNCTYHVRLEAFHDGELDAVARIEVARHLETCPACTAELVDIRGISQLFSNAPVPRLSQISLHRLHANLNLLTDRGLLKIARILTGLAASVLVLGSLWLTRSSSVAPVTHAPSLVAFLDESSAAPVEPGPSDWEMTELAK